MEPLFLTAAIVITIAWIGLFLFYMRTVSRQKELLKELAELEDEFNKIRKDLDG